MNNNKRKIFVSAKLLPGQSQIHMLYVHANANLLLELSEKQAMKYLMMSDNDFGKMIEDLVIVTNSKLKIENVNTQQYQVREVMGQGFYAYVDENEGEVIRPPEDGPEGMNSQASFAKFYKNLKIIPRGIGGKNTLTHQLSQATNFQHQNQPNIHSLKNQVFNVNSEQNFEPGDMSNR